MSTATTNHVHYRVSRHLRKMAQEVSDLLVERDAGMGHASVWSIEDVIDSAVSRWRDELEKAKACRHPGGKIL